MSLNDNELNEIVELNIEDYVPTVSVPLIDTECEDTECEDTDDE